VLHPENALVLGRDNLKRRTGTQGLFPNNNPHTPESHIEMILGGGGSRAAGLRLE
jgi:hypothetical protein